MAADPVTRITQLFEDVWNGHAPATADDLVHPEYTIHDRPIAAELAGPELYRTLADQTRAIFPDMSFHIEDTLADGQRVALRWVMTGTHEGAFFGVEPTGETVQLKAIEINRFDDGRLIETWTQSDMLGLLQQLGAIPEA